MRRLMLRAGAVFTLALGIAGVLPAPSAVAQDPKADPKVDPKADPKANLKTDPKAESPSPSETPMKEAAPKPPTFPGYVFVTDVMGEVVRADDKTVKLRITWYQPQVKNPTNRRPNLNANNRNFHNPYAANRNQPQVTYKEVHHDYDLDYLPQSLVRVKHLPPKYDEKGKRAEYTSAELKELKVPREVVGYNSDRSAVVPGTYLEVFLLRDKNVLPEKATDADLKIKYAVIWGQDPSPPKDIANGSAGSTKKN
jgi:hypothetical protein